MPFGKFTCYDYFFLTIGALGYALGFTYRGSLSPIVDALQDELNINATGMGALSSSFYISYTAMQLPSGLLLEIYSPNLILIICWFGLGLAVISFGFITSLTLGIIVQFFCGIFIGPLFLAAASDGQMRFGNKHLSLIIAVIIKFAFISVLLAGLLQAFLFDEYGRWREYFYAWGFMCILLSILGIFLRLNEGKHMFSIAKEKEKENNNDIHEMYQREMDTFDADADDTKPLIEHSVSKSFDYYVYKHSSSIAANIKDTKTGKFSQLKHALKLTVKNYNNWIVGVHAFCSTAVVLALNGLWFIQYLMEKFEYSRSFATFVNGLFYVSSAVGGLVFGKLAAVYPNRRKLMVIICTILNGFCLPIMYIFDGSTHAIIIILLNCLSGCGAIFSITFALLREYNPKECGDTATGFAATCGNVAGLTVPFFIGELMDYNWNKRGGNDFLPNSLDERHYNTSDYNVGFLIFPACFVIQLLASFVLKQPINSF